MCLFHLFYADVDISRDLDLPSRPRGSRSALHQVREEVRDDPDGGHPILAQQAHRRALQLKLPVSEQDN